MTKTKFKTWYSKHRISFCVFVFLVGIILGILQSIILKSPLDFGVKFGFLYGFLFLVTELSFDHKKYIEE